MPASRDQRDDRAVAHPLDELGGPLALVVLVVGDQRRLHAVALEQHPRAARVLAGDDVGLAQRGEHAQRDVLEVPDRRRADDQAAALMPPLGEARARRRPAPASSRASSAAPIIPASAPNAAATTRTDVARRARARARSITSRAGASSSSPAAITPPPMTTTSGLKMFDEVRDPDAERAADHLDRAARHRVAVRGPAR